MARKIIILGLGALLASIALVGCSSGSSSDDAAPSGPPPEVAPSNNPERLKSQER